MPEELEISLPSFDSIENIAVACRALDEAPNSKRYVVNVTGAGFYSPLGMALIGAKIRQFGRLRKDHSSIVIRHSRDTYPKHMGFYDLCGCDVEKPFGPARGSLNYLPIGYVRASTIHSEARAGGVRAAEVVHDRAGKLANILIRKEGPVRDTIRFCIREIVRNCVEHGEATIVIYCAQYWPSKGQAEIAIVDNGIGIRNALSNNPKLDIDDDKSAIENSILPGVSGVAWGRKQKNEWDNSGFGLYMMKRICHDYGQLGILTGDSAYMNNMGTEEYYSSSWSGTGTRIRLNTNAIQVSPPDLLKYSEEGEAMSKTIAGASKSGASAASKGYT